MNNISLTLKAFKRAPSQDSSTWYMGSLMTFLAECKDKDTNGSFALSEYNAKAGNEPPLHVHEREDELYYVLEGEIDAFVGDEVFRLKTGESLFLPKGKPHSSLFVLPIFGRSSYSYLAEWKDTFAP